LGNFTNLPPYLPSQAYSPAIFLCLPAIISGCPIRAFKRLPAAVVLAYEWHRAFNKTKMKKIILEILIGLTLPAAIFHTQLTDVFVPEKAVNKEISVSIARDSTYDAQVYDMALATVHLVVFKVSNHKQVVLWDKTYDTMQLKKYPTIGSAFRQTVRVRNIWDRKEKLYVTYTVTYNNNGCIMKLENGTALARGEKQGSLFINL